MRNVTDIIDLSKSEIDGLIKTAIDIANKPKKYSKILKGKRLTLLWEVENYDTILLDGVDVTFKKSWDKIVDFSTSYKLEVINGRKKKEQDRKSVV